MCRLPIMTFIGWIMMVSQFAYAHYPALEVNGETLRSVVSDITGIQPARNHLHTESLDRAADRIQDGFTAIGLETTAQPFEVRGSKYRNLIASVRTDLPERFVVGAHYDVCGDQPGADDNASAVAGLLEIARLVKASQNRLRYRIDFVAYSLEEPPYFGTRNMGSYLHAKALYDGGVSLRGMISLEMIGYFTDAPESQRFPVGLMRFFYPTTGNFIAVVGNLKSRSLVKEIRRHMRRSDVPVESLTSPQWVPGVGLSDQLNFWKHGYPAVMITDTAFYRNSNYHTPGDTASTLDFEKMAEVVKGVTWALLNLK